MFSVIERDSTSDPRRRSAPSAVRGALGAMSLSMLLASLGTSVANVALPTLAHAFGRPFQAIQWVVLAYLLSVTTLVVGAGRLGDIVGRRRLLLAGVTLFTIASLLCGLAPTLPVLVLARGAQGIGAAVMMAMTMAFVGEAVPSARTGSAMGILATMSAIGTALGPTLGGALLAGPGWRALFLINVPLGIVGLLLSHRYLPVDRVDARSERLTFDVPGTALLALTLGAYALGMTIGRGAFGATNVALLAGAATGAALFARVESRAAQPLVRLTMLTDRVLYASLLANALVATVMMATLVVGPFYLARALGLSPVMVGLAMSAGPIVAALSGVPAGRIADTYGARRVALAGLGAVTLGAWLVCGVPGRLGVMAYVAPVAIITAGYALFHTANNAAVMSEAAADQRGVVSGLLALSRNLGLVTGASVMGALFARASGAADVATAAPAAVALGMRVTFAVAGGLALVAFLLVANAGRGLRAAAAGGASNEA